MSKKYIASIVGTQDVCGEKNEIQLFVPCDYKIEKDFKYISYEEFENNNPKIKILSTLKIFNDGLVSLTKVGKKLSKLTLEKNKRHQCFYSTEFGDLIIGVYTTNVSNNLSELGGNLNLSYSLDSNSELLSNNTVSITVKEV